MSDTVETQGAVTEAARERSQTLWSRYQDALMDLEPRYLVQMAHLTTPATIWKYVEKAVTRSAANLVMLDLEDSIPRDDEELLGVGRANVIRALNELPWGGRLKFFRPRGLELDPSHEDIAAVVRGAGGNLDGLVYPKIQSAEEVASIDQTISALEREQGLRPGRIKIEPLIESAMAVEEVFSIARSSGRLAGLVFGSYDYWGSLGRSAASYRFDHPLLGYARARIVQAAASVGIPAIAEMTTNYPTSDKSEDEKRAALAEFRRDAELARDYGFAGKWTGIPEQTNLAVEIFSVSEPEISRAVEEARAFALAEREGRGAVMMGGRMADRAMDRLNRNLLKLAYAMGKLDPDLAGELGIVRPD